MLFRSEGLGELIDFNPHSADDLPTGSGVYVFYDLSNRPIYIGQSEDMKRRIREHREKFWFKAPIMKQVPIIGGRERTKQEFATLFAAARLKLTRVVSTKCSLSIVEGIPV